MISRGLIVSLGTTSLVSVLLFLYFRNRMTSVEHKVSMLFKLIEDHHQQQQVQFMERMQPPRPPPNNLINVSDGEADESESDESEYETEDDDESESGGPANESSGCACITILAIYILKKVEVGVMERRSAVQGPARS